MEDKSLFRVHKVVQRVPSLGEINELERAQEKTTKKDELLRQRAVARGGTYEPNKRKKAFNAWEDDIVDKETKALDARLKLLMQSE